MEAAWGIVDTHASSQPFRETERRKLSCWPVLCFCFLTPLLEKMTSVAPSPLFPIPKSGPLPGGSCAGIVFPATCHLHLQNWKDCTICCTGGNEQRGEGRWQASTAAEEKAPLGPTSEMKVSPQVMRWCCGVYGQHGLDSQHLFPAALRLKKNGLWYAHFM